MKHIKSFLKKNWFELILFLMMFSVLFIIPFPTRLDQWIALFLILYLMQDNIDRELANDISKLKTKVKLLEDDLFYGSLEGEDSDFDPPFNDEV